MRFKKLLLAIFVLFLVSCSEKVVKHLDCEWVIPSEMEEVSDTYYSGLNESGQHSLRFMNSSYDDTSEYVTLIEEHTNGALKVAVYESTEKAPQKGIKSYIVSRNGYDGVVISFDSDYRKYLGECKTK